MGFEAQRGSTRNGSGRWRGVGLRISSGRCHKHHGWMAKTTDTPCPQSGGWSPSSRCGRAVLPAAPLLGVRMALSLRPHVVVPLCVCVPISSYEDTSHTRPGPTV